MWRAAGAALAGSALLASSSLARDLWSDGDRSFSLRTSIKGSLLASHAPNDASLYPERDSATSFWRLRLEPEARLGEKVTLALAYEHRLRVFSAGEEVAGLGVLPPETPPPFRVRELDWPVLSSPHLAWRHEIDRASVALHLRRVDLTLGRQAVGWGRGALFGAVDLFSPFSPLEADREWRRGVDAVRAEVKLADRVSTDVVAAIGRSADASTFAARLRGYAGKADLELVAGRRARDLFAGATSSVAVGGAEVHGELAVFRAPQPLPAAAGGGRTVLKAVAGGSQRFGLGNGLLVYLEYHFSGFGAESAADVPRLLADPGFQERYLRGDTQILGRHAIAALATYELSPELTLSAQWLQSPTDASGIAAPSATFTFGDKASALVTAYLPYGKAPSGGALRSEYGAAARSLFLQLRIYD